MFKPKEQICGGIVPLSCVFSITSPPAQQILVDDPEHEQH